MHPMVFISAVIFNLLNGTLMGGWIGGRVPHSLIDKGHASGSEDLVFWGGLIVWALGLAANIAHDEILYELRRNHKRQQSASPEKKEKQARLHYALPHGLLYSYPFGGVSSPAYLVEWIEWAAYAVSCSTILVPPQRWFFEGTSWPRSFMTPPWIFFWAEVGTMLPRAVRTHQWYRQQFPDLPKNRKAIIPGLV
jgi:3-oxo-5-alpha-steroid 4-dehydrogenase 1